MTEKELIEKLAESSSFGRVALFLGTGFSKAVLGYTPLGLGHFNSDLAGAVPSWTELLGRCRGELMLPSKKYQIDLAIDCPAEASQIVSELSGAYGREEAERRLKDTISKFIDFYPNPEQVCAFQGLLKKIKPAIIITTNYDNVIETILHNGYYSYGAGDVVCGLPAGMTPIYHLHGECGNPMEMVITREDYVKALSPTSYRQRKLACIMRENAIVYIGYSKSDINVLSAMDIAENAFLDLPRKDGLLQVQVVYGSNSNEMSAVDGGGSRYSIRCDDTFMFLQRLANQCEKACEERSNRLERRQKQYEKLLQLPISKSVAVIKEKREGVASIIKQLAGEIAQGGLDSWSAKGMLIILVQKLYDAARGESYKELNFSAYDDCLFILIELLVNMETLGMRSFFFDFTMKHLEDVACYVGTERGQSWSADASLKKAWHRIPNSVIMKVVEHAERHCLNDVVGIMRKMKQYGSRQEALSAEFK